ncbi:MAG: prepilin-type N-terminal cleavage/methylation domain-containing protein [Oscillospiraceae bacterium]|nr:prepilin-type N-terminal cleavage/methylation domain-containing protein [Oscillospiraceae bacterium]
MFLKARNSRKGFTIIELVIVIAIIGILSAVLIPNFSGVVFNANTTAAAANLSSMNKIAKTSAGATGTPTMLKAYAAAVQNFGYDSVKAAVGTAVYSSTKNEFVPLADVKVEDEKYDTTNFYPVAASATQTAVESFEALPFVDKIEGKPNLVTTILANTISGDNGKYVNVYTVKGSIALYDDLNLGDAAVVFLNGASVELNGKTLGAKAVLFLDTTNGANDVKFSVNGGMVNTYLGYAVTSVASEDFSATYAAPASNKIEFTQDAMITSLVGGAYVNVANASYYLEGGVLLPGNAKLTLDGESHLVVKDGAYLLTDNGDKTNQDFGAVQLVLKDGTKLDVSDNSVVSLIFADGEANHIISGHSVGSNAWNSVNPMTYEICASAVQNTLVLYAMAGADQATVMAVFDKFAVSVNNTVQGLANNGYVTATGAVAAIGEINTATANAVYGAISSSVASGTSAVVGNAAAGAIASLAGVSTPAQVRATLASNTSNASSENANSKYSSTDYSFYSPKSAENPKGYDTDGTYHITNAKQLYALSWIVAKGIDDFYGHVVSIDNDIDLGDYENWKPIGDGNYGFRGTLVGKEISEGKYPTISNMKIDSESNTLLLSLMGNTWSGTATRADREGTNYGRQTGDKYAVGFVGVLENGGSISNLNFSNCYVRLEYNWNCSAAIVCGVMVATGEDYTDNDGGLHITTNPVYDEHHIATSYADYKTTGNNDMYNTQGPSWTFDGDGKINGAINSTAYADRAYKGWETTIYNVTTDSSCEVICAGRAAGIVGSAGGRYSADGGTNNDYDSAPYKGYRNGTKDKESIFCCYGKTYIISCTNGAKVTTKPEISDNYYGAGGIISFFVKKGGYDNTIYWYVEDCHNSGSITGQFASGIAAHYSPTCTSITGCSNNGTLTSLKLKAAPNYHNWTDAFDFDGNKIT